MNLAKENLEDTGPRYTGLPPTARGQEHLVVFFFNAAMSFCAECGCDLSTTTKGRRSIGEGSRALNQDILRSILLTWKELVSIYSDFNTTNISKLTMCRQCFRDYDKLTRLLNQDRKNLDTAGGTLAENDEISLRYCVYRS